MRLKEETQRRYTLIEFCNFFSTSLAFLGLNSKEERMVRVRELPMKVKDPKNPIHASSTKQQLLETLVLL